MKKTIVVAALLSAALALSAMPASAATMTSATKTGVEDKCFVLPGLPNCITEWKAEAEAHGWSYTPIPTAWWTCKPAAKDAGHLLDCDAK